MPAVSRPPRIVALGARAATALAHSGGALRLIPGFTETPYRLAGEDIIWIGTRGEAHPRAVFVDAPLETMALAWDAPPRPAGRHDHGTLDRERAAPLFAELARRCRELGEPRGLGKLLIGLAPPFPLDLRADTARALAAAVDAGDAQAFEHAGRRLLGVGGGLTPSGDDFVGAALFTLCHLGEARWQGAADALRAAIPSRSHAISAALFADLASGESFEPLHQLLAAVPLGIDAMLEPARRLAAIGHSSGWDMLTGMIAAATGGLTENCNAH
jgi:hypothetical protein